jgi:uncharacterized membrane protein YphA (DoxX/SURF4 family)
MPTIRAAGRKEKTRNGIKFIHKNMKRYQSIFLFILRIVIGWHFLYEGIIKLFIPDWSAEAYLRGSYGFLSGFFHWLASDPGLLNIVNFLNIWGMILIGIGLFLGIFIRISSVAGIAFLLLYYFAYPPFGSSVFSVSSEGHYWIINRNLIEALILVVIYFWPAKEYSLEKFIGYFKNKSKKEPDVPLDNAGDGSKRRELLKGLISLPLFSGMVIGAALRNKSVEPDVLSGATIALKKFDLSELKGELPKGKIGNLEMTRLILGCNLIGGWAHARDLLYANQLFRQYNSENKIFETLNICEQAGINTTNMVNQFYPLLNKYKKITGSKIMSICQVHMDKVDQDPLYEIKEAIDYGATSVYIQGAYADRFVKAEKMDILWKAVDYVRSQGYLAGIGAHSIQTPIACEKAGLKPDYYFKTVHHDQYWSANPREFRVEFQLDGEYFLDHNKYHDNIFDLFPEQTVEVFKGIDVPWVGFKVLAGGAIQPEDGFRYAFKNGADFICVGMFDFQVVEDVNLVIDILNGDLERERKWFA